jgi:anti-sigma B factor antagonist
MIISKKICSNITIITLQGSLDASSVHQFQSFTEVSSAADPVVIDLSGVDFLDSSGLGAVVGIARKKREQGGEVVLACMNDKVRKVFEITQVYKLFDIYDDIEAAAMNVEKKRNSL